MLLPFFQSTNIKDQHQKKGEEKKKQPIIINATKELETELPEVWRNLRFQSFTISSGKPDDTDGAVNSRRVGLSHGNSQLTGMETTNTRFLLRAQGMDGFLLKVMGLFLLHRN